jgi:hypothetical protein
MAAHQQIVSGLHTYRSRYKKEGKRADLINNQPLGESNRHENISGGFSNAGMREV